MVNICCVKDCDQKGRKSGKMHRFPKDENLRKNWLLNIKNDELLTKKVDNYRVCDKHFAEKHRVQYGIRGSGLKKDALPTLFLGNYSRETAIEKSIKTIIFDTYFY